AKTPAEIIYDLLTTYANVPATFIDLDEWEEEIDSFLGVLYTRMIAEPTGVEKLVNELIQQAGLILWWDNIARKVRLQVLKGIVTDTFEYNEENIIDGSILVEEQREKLITEVWTYYGVRKPLEGLEEPNNYRSAIIYANGEQSALNGSPVIKKIFGTWIPTFGQLAAERTNLLHAGRFIRPPRKVMFAVPRHTDIPLPVEAGGYKFRYHGGQDEIGQQAE